MRDIREWGCVGRYQVGQPIGSDGDLTQRTGESSKAEEHSLGIYSMDFDRLVIAYTVSF